MLAPMGFGVIYFVFPVLFFLFFIMVGITAVVTRLRARRRHPPAQAVERMYAAVRQKRTTGKVHRRYLAVFLLATGGEAVFLLTRAQYHALSEGARGVLVHKGARLLCFEQQKEQTM